jgi:hypothetical protein
MVGYKDDFFGNTAITTEPLNQTSHRDSRDKNSIFIKSEKEHRE